MPLTSVKKKGLPLMSSPNPRQTACTSTRHHPPHQESNQLTALRVIGAPGPRPHQEAQVPEQANLDGRQKVQAPVVGGLETGEEERLTTLGHRYRVRLPILGCGMLGRLNWVSKMPIHIVLLAVQQ